MIEEKIILLKKEIIGFASHVENMIEKSIRGLLQKEAELLNEIISKDEPVANEFEIAIDEKSITLIAQFQPKAKELRTILMISRMANDFERMGDHAVNIAQHALSLIEKPAVKPLIDIPRMAEEAVSMLKDSIDSFINGNVRQAKNICERDNIVDGLRDQILRELIIIMIADPLKIERGLALITISKNLERIADLSTNICEDVIFMEEGRVIKHNRKSEEENK